MDKVTEFTAIPDRINDHIWFDKYKPIENGANLGTYYAVDDVNYTWETYSPEVDIVNLIDPQFVWTLIETDDGQFIIAGRHHVNRLAYFICEEPFHEYEEYTCFREADHIAFRVQSNDFVSGGSYDIDELQSAILMLEADDVVWEPEIAKLIEWSGGVREKLS